MKMDIKQAEKEVSNLQKELNALSKEFAETGDEKKRFEKQMEMDQKSTAMKEKLEELDKMKINFAAVSKEAKNAAREMEQCGREQSKLDNRATRKKTASDVLSGLAAAGFTQMIGDIAVQAAGTYVSSTFGNEKGTLINSALGGAISGAAMGSMVLPGWGTVIGGAVGGVAGLANGQLQNEQSRDDDFKSYVKDQYEGIQQQQQNDLTAGSAIAASREKDLVSFTTLLGGREKAREYLDGIKSMANSTPFLYDDLASMSKTLKVYGYTPEELLDHTGEDGVTHTGVLTKVGDAGAAVGMSTADMNVIATAIGRMKSSGKTDLENINILQDRGIDAIGYLADGFGKTREEIYELISSGSLKGGDSAETILRHMGNEYSGSMADQSRTYSGLQSTLTGLQQELQNAEGEGFNNTRTLGMREEIEFLQGDGGAKMQEANKMIGEFKASLENEKEELQRAALTSVMDGVISDKFKGKAKEQFEELAAQYKAAEQTREGSQKAMEHAAYGSEAYKNAKQSYEKAGAEMGLCLEKAKAFAQNEYNAGEGAQLELNSQLNLVESLRQNAALQDEYWKTGRVMGEQFSKGMGESMLSGLLGDKVADAVEEFKLGKTSQQSQKKTPGAAWGMPYVPYNDYPVRLHEGERVLTAQESRSYQSGGPPNISVNLNGDMTVRGESDIDSISERVVRKILQAMELAK